MRLFSFEMAIDLTRGYDPTDDFVIKSIRDIHQRIETSQVAQEARALTAQLDALSAADHAQLHSRAEHLTDHFQTAIDAHLQNPTTHTGENTPTLTPHAIGWWLSTKLDDLDWSIPITDIAFRLGTADRRSNVDMVLYSATSVDPDELAETNEEQQWKLLADQLEACGNERPDTVTGKTGDLPPLPTDWNITPTPTTELQNQQTRSINTAVEHNRIEAVPLWAPSYPGVDEQKTLLNLLEGLYVTSVGEDRRLYIEPDVWEWAGGTDLLDLAVDLWKLREKTTMRLLRTAQQHVGYDTEGLAELLRGIDRGADPSTFPNPYEFDGLTEAWKAAADGLTADRSDLRRGYAGTIADLRELGAAILKDDKRMIGRYLSKGPKRPGPST